MQLQLELTLLGSGHVPPSGCSACWPALAPFSTLPGSACRLGPCRPSQTAPQSGPAPLTAPRQVAESDSSSGLLPGSSVGPACVHIQG